MQNFHASYLGTMQDTSFSDIQRQCFLLEWHDSRSRLAPDIEGNILNALVKPEKILNYTVDISIDPPEAINHAMQMKKLEDLAGLNLKSEHENTTILMEIMKYSGKDVNLVEAYSLFCDCHNKKQKESSVTLRAWFLKALAELKYCGLVSATR
jgi:hypothetical protein